MTTTLAQVFTEYFAHLKFDSKLAKALYRYQIGYINQNHEHLEFFSGNLLGVQVIRFKDSDVLKLFNDVLDIDLIQLTNTLKDVDDVNQDFKVSSDVLNLTCTYLIHGFLTSKVLNDTQRDRAAYDCAVIFFYRCIAALMSYYFKYPADPKVAQAAYANLSNKYLIKRLGSWHKVVDYRAKDVISKNGLHRKAFISYNDDIAIVHAINDMQGRIRDMIKNYYSEFKKVGDDGEAIHTTSSSMLDAQGEETIREKTKSTESLITYIQNIIVDKKSFVKDDYVKIIVNINKNTSTRMVKTTLDWLSDNSNDSKHHKEIDDFVRLVIVHSLHLINKQMSHRSKRDYVYILTELKNLYLSSRSESEDLFKIRELGDKLIKTSMTTKVSKSLILATRTSVILYIVLRTLIGYNN